MRSRNRNYTFPKVKSIPEEPKARIERAKKLALILLKDSDEGDIRVSKTAFGDLAELASAFKSLGCQTRKETDGSLVVTRGMSS